MNQADESGRRTRQANQANQAGESSRRIKKANQESKSGKQIKQTNQTLRTRRARTRPTEMARYYLVDSQFSSAKQSGE